MCSCCKAYHYAPSKKNMCNFNSYFLGQVENSEITETSKSDFPMFPFPSFCLSHRVYSKIRKMKAGKIFSEISEKFEFSNCHF